MFAYLETLKIKPGHIRERIAMGTAAGVTAIVAIGWFVVATSSGTFALAPANFAATDTSNDIGSAFEDTKSSFNSLLGAVGAAQNGQSADSGITVETQTSTTAGSEQPTTIPF